MLKQIGFIFVLILFLPLVMAAKVDIDADVFKEYTLFTYKFQFDTEDSYRSFSFEKPKDAKIDYVLNDLEEEVKYSVAGDYFIFQPEKTDNRTFGVRFSSKTISSSITQEGKFLVYLNFNFPVDNLNLNLNLKDNFVEPIEIFPRDYSLDDNSYSWSLTNIESDTLILLDFGSKPLPNTNSLFNKIWISTLLMFFAVVILLILGYFLLYKNRGSRKNSNIEKNIEVKDSNEKLEKQKEELNEENFEEFTNKYLTENEKEIVEVVKENDGISQYDILNFLPTISKSNLSKIITKLNSKRILNRIRVGKVNKIYLGEKLEKKVDSKEN